MTDILWLLGPAATVAASGIFPWIAGEAVVAGAVLLAPSALIPLVVLSCTLTQVGAKVVVYGIARWAPSRMPPRATALLERAERYRGRQWLLAAGVLSGSAVALPPFYLVTLAAGTLRLPLPLFVPAALVGTIARYAFTAWVAVSVAGA